MHYLAYFLQFNYLFSILMWCKCKAETFILFILSVVFVLTCHYSVIFVFFFWLSAGLCQQTRLDSVVCAMLYPILISVLMPSAPVSFGFHRLELQVHPGILGKESARCQDMSLCGRITHILLEVAFVSCFSFCSCILCFANCMLLFKKSNISP